MPTWITLGLTLQEIVIIGNGVFEGMICCVGILVGKGLGLYTLVIVGWFIVVGYWDVGYPVLGVDVESWDVGRTKAVIKNGVEVGIGVNVG